jgi:hypothetical protein
MVLRKRSVPFSSPNRRSVSMVRGLFTNRHRNKRAQI